MLLKDLLSLHREEKYLKNNRYLFSIQYSGYYLKAFCLNPNSCIQIEYTQLLSWKNNLRFYGFEKMYIFLSKKDFILY